MAFKVKDLVIAVIPARASSVGTLQMCARASPVCTCDRARTYYRPALTT
jgi:hypothetical protein